MLWRRLLCFFFSWSPSRSLRNSVLSPKPLPARTLWYIGWAFSNTASISLLYTGEARAIPRWLEGNVTVKRSHEGEAKARQGGPGAYSPGNSWNFKLQLTNCARFSAENFAGIARGWSCNCTPPKVTGKVSPPPPPPPITRAFLHRHRLLQKTGSASPGPGFVPDSRESGPTEPDGQQKRLGES